IVFRDNDFLCHCNVGRWFLDGKPYHHNSFIMYPVGRVMMDGLLALAPVRVSRAICYLLAILAVYGCYCIWQRMIDAGSQGAGSQEAGRPAGGGPANEGVSFAAAVCSVVLIVGYMLRDLDDCGLQLFLLFFL